MRKIFRHLLVIAGAALTFATGPAYADYPDKIVRLIVPYPPGGTSDVLARIIAQRMGELLHKTVMVENKAGGSGIIGVQAVATAAPDGYTLLLANSGTHGVNSALMKSLPYDPVKDFTPITLIGSPPNVLMANPSVTAKNFTDFAAAAHAKPGTLNVGTTSLGGSPHMSGELLKLQQKLDITLVPYKGAGPMLMDLIAGNIQYGLDNLPSSIGYIRAGSVRAIAVTTAKRWPGLPDVPTLAESGVPGFDVSGWFGLFAPAGTPAPIIDKIYATVRQVLQEPEVIKRFYDAGAAPGGNSPDAFKAQVAAEVDKWQKLVASTGMKIE